MNGVIIPSDLRVSWTDCTESGQSYGTAKYRIEGKTIFIYVTKGVGSLAGWTKIGQLPTGYSGIATGDEFITCAYHNGTGQVNFDVNSVGGIYVIGTLNNITSLLAIPFGA